MPKQTWNIRSKIWGKLFVWLHIKEDEQDSFRLLYSFSFFMGFFLSFYFTPANGLFIKYISALDMPYAYLGIGVLGFGLVKLYSWQQGKLALSRLHYLTLVAMLAFVVLMFAGLLFWQQSHFLFGLMFVLVGPFFTFTALIFGGVTLQVFDLGQSKRMYSLANSGQMLSSFIAFLSTSLILSIPQVKSSHLLVLSAGSMVVAMYYFRQIVLKHSTQLNRVLARKKLPKGAQKPKPDKYIQLISLTALLSSITIYLIDFDFLRSIDALPGDRDPSLFISQFFTFLKLSELVMAFLSSRILRTYGISLGVSLLPFLLLFTIIVASAIGLGLEDGFLLFFIFVSFGKLIERVLRKSIDAPAFKVLFQPMSTSQKLATQTRVEGTVKQVGIGISGIMLIIFTQGAEQTGLLPSLMKEATAQKSLLYFTIGLIPIMALWVFFSRQVYKGYKRKLTDFLQSLRKRTTKATATRFSELKTLALGQGEKSFHSLIILGETHYGQLRPYLPEILRKLEPAQAHWLLRRMPLLHIHGLLPEIEALRANSPESQIDGAISGHSKQVGVAPPKYPLQQVQNLGISPNREEQLAALLQLVHHSCSSPQSVIANLLRSDFPDVVREALYLLEKYPNPSVLPILVELFPQPRYMHDVIPRLVDLGDAVLYELDLFFERDMPVLVLKQIIYTFQQIGTDKAMDYLLKRWDYPDYEIRREIMMALFNNDFQVQTDQQSAVKDRLTSTIDTILWLTQCSEELRGHPNTLKLLQVLEEERNMAYADLFKILGFLYDKQTINNIQENLKTSENVFAIEVADNLFDEGIKEYVLPLLEGIEGPLLVRRMELLFPQRHLSLKDRLRDIINRDYNSVDLVVKEHALELLGKLPDTLPLDVFACIYHPDRQLHETAAQVIQNKITDYSYFWGKSGWLDKMKMRQLENPERKKRILLSEILKDINRFVFFYGTSEQILMKLAKQVRPKTLAPGDILNLQTPENNELVLLLRKGQLAPYPHENGTVFSRDEILMNGMRSLDGATQLIALKTSQGYLIDRTNFFILVGTEPLLQEAFFEYPLDHW